MELLTGWFVTGEFDRQRGCMCPRGVKQMVATPASCRYDDSDLVGPYASQAEAEAAYQRLDRRWRGVDGITAYRWATGPAGSGIEVLRDGTWVAHSTGPFADTEAAELRQAGVPEMPAVEY